MLVFVNVDGRHEIGAERFFGTAGKLVIEEAVDLLLQEKIQAERGSTRRALNLA